MKDFFMQCSKDLHFQLTKKLVNFLRENIVENAMHIVRLIFFFTGDLLSDAAN
jgi:hypothetical protein